MVVQRKLLFWVLFLITIYGNFLVIHAALTFAIHYSSTQLLLICEIAVVALLLAPWSAKMPSGASWRPGIPITTLSIFLIPPVLIPLVPLVALVFLTARSRAPWWKYFQTFGHVTVGLYIGASTYVYFLQVLHHVPLHRLLAAIPALAVHLFVNRLISAFIVAHRDKRKLSLQLQMTLQELHWGYLNSYLLTLLGSMLGPQYLVVGVLLITILQAGIFMAVAHYNKIEQLQRSAWTDGLTNLENQSAWERFRDTRTSDLDKSVLAVVDVNNLKDINDKYGHLQGDVLLRTVANVLQSVVPKDGRVFRVGGDEFVVFSKDVHDMHLDSAIQMAMLEHHRKNQELIEYLSVSVGQAFYPTDGTSLLQLFQVADHRMYKQKRRIHYDASGIEYGIPNNILSLIFALESRHSYTSGHSLRVAFYALQLGRKMGLSDSTLQCMFRATLVHDIGKIGTPDSILNKVGQFTSEEMEIMRQHVITGYEMCSKLGFNEDELGIIRHHHENWDGTGYPDKLSAYEIPLLARIVSVCDVYDALTTVRSYRNAWSHETTIRYLVENRGIKFDREIVDAWLALNLEMRPKESYQNWLSGTTFANQFAEAQTV